MSAEQIAAWFAGRVPDDWFTAAVVVRVDRDEIVVTGRLAEPKVDTARSGDDDGAADALHLACTARAGGFREDTRATRMRIAAEAEARFERKVSWAVECGPLVVSYTTASVPVMTRLRMDERSVLDTLIAAGVARSRSEALAWCVRLVGRHEQDWIEQLRNALAAVHDARAGGPDLVA